MQEFALQPSSQRVYLRIPTDAHGPVHHPVLLVGRILPQTTQPGSPASRPSSRPGPVVIHIKSGDKQLPPWTLGEHASGYVISLATVDANTGHSDGELWLDMQLDARGPTQISSLTSPDILAVSKDRDGPLAGLAAELPAGPAHEYFDAICTHMTGDTVAAKTKYEAAAAGNDERIARFARRGLRILKFLQRPSLRQDDFAAHRRSALYAQTCGFFALAFGEWSNIGGFDLESGDAWFRLGEVAERLGWPLNDVTQAMGRAGYAMDVQEPVNWYTLVVVLAEEDSEVKNADGTISKTTIKLTPEQVQAIYQHWFVVEQMVLGASGGALQINTHYLYIADKKVQPYALYGNWVYGPTDDIFPVRGSYDSVMSFRPLGANHSGGSDLGPNGAALSDLPATANWQDMMLAWMQQYDWAMATCESNTGFPLVQDWEGCGDQPIPFMGAGLRSELRYYASPAMYRKTLLAAPTSKLVVTSMPSSQPSASQSTADLISQWKYHAESANLEYLRRWKLEGPYPSPGGSNADGLPLHHVLDNFPPSGSPAKERVIDSATDFIDLGNTLGVGSGLARASCWVYSPEAQFAQVWIGHNDGMALWVNGECVHRGDYYAAGRWEDQNMPDMIMAHAILEPGWNHLETVIEGLAAPRDKGWGFSVRLADRVGKPLVGVAYRTSEPPAAEKAAAWKPPQAGAYYTWGTPTAPGVEMGYHEFLPQLTNTDLARITGVAKLSITGQINGGKGYVAIGAVGEPAGDRLRALPVAWNGDHDSDVAVNNLLDWSRENICLFPYTKSGKQRALLLLRPEATRPYLELLTESPDAKTIFNGKTLRERILGWVAIPAGSTTRTMILVDTALGDPKSWPIDEEDLLAVPGPSPAKPEHKWGPATWPAITKPTATASAPAGR